MGTPQAAVPSLERILIDGHEVVAVYTQPDKPSGRGNKITFSPVKELALARGLAVFQPQRIKPPEALEQFQSHRADVALVVAYGRILPATFLNAFSNGAINVHFSLLPKYRGAAPVNWAIVNGETETGVTTMKMDEGLDTGDILLQRSTAIGSDETAIALMERLSVVGAELLSETLRELDSLKPVKQDTDLASLAPIMKKEDGLIDWKSSATEIADRVRGFQPFPTAYTYFQSKRLTLWQAGATESASDSFSLGEVVEAKGNELTISCGFGLLKIGELQLEGKKRMSTRDFLNGVKLKIGDSLG
jgi:methionyl-tRNA formyltransferase